MTTRSHQTALVGGLLAIGLTLYLSTGCSLGCVDHSVSEKVSPDGRLKAVIFSRNCGATTWFTTELSVIPVKETVADGSMGNVLSMADDENSPTPISRGGSIEAHVYWISPDVLTVSVPRQAVVGKRARRVKNIKILFSTF